MLEIHYTGSFKKDFKRAKKQRYNLELLKVVIEYLASRKKLPDRFRDHKLIGNYAGRRECHLEPDLLLIYMIKGQKLYLERLGSHSDLFR